MTPRKTLVNITLRAFAKLRLYLPISQLNLPNVSHVMYVVYFTPSNTADVS